MSSIEIQNLSIEFPIFGHHSFRKALVSGLVGGVIGSGNRDENKTTIVCSLQHINLSIGNGDRLGLIGHNGAGKTTLLKVIAGIYQPAIGSIRTDGRISPMFNIGLGMDLEESGYENIKTMGLYLGMSLAEIEDNIPKIEKFTELGDFLNFPVRTYSAGMMIRLSFAVATSKEPDILLLDEIIGAGDASFQDKVNERVDSIVYNSKIMVLASHSVETIRRFCNRALILEKGRIIFDGDVGEAISRYENSNINSA